jgi:hypothetical protein
MTQGTTTNSSRALIGYAVLRANFNHDAPSYVDNFSGFVLDVLARRHPEAIDEATAGEDIRRAFGFTIPDRVVGTLLRRAAKSKIAEQSGVSFVLSHAHLGQVADIEADMSRFERQQRELVTKFHAFVIRTAPDRVRVIEDKPEAHLQNFIEEHAVPLLRRAVRGDRSDHPAWGDLDGSGYLVSAFIGELAESDNVAFGYVVEAVKGAILAAVVDLGTGNLKQRLDRLTFILDTPVILKGLGYVGATQQRAVRQTLDLAASLHANVVCFDHTAKEVDGVLDSVQGVLRSRGRTQGSLREVDAFFLDAGYGAADIEVERGHLHENLRALGVKEISKPDDYYSYGLDEGDLDQLLQQAVGYRADTTRRYDVLSLSAIHRLRSGTSPNDFERCGHVLISDNRRLVNATRKVDERHGWPLAMLDSDLASLLWVRSPAVAEDLPRQQLLATVYAGMQPGGHLWSKYLIEIERLQREGRVNEDEALILRARPEARRALMDITLGRAADIDTESISAVLERVRSDLEGPLREQVKQAFGERDEALDVASSAQSRGASQVSLLEGQIDTLTKQVTSHRRETDKQDVALRRRAETVARRYLDCAVYGVGLILLATAAVKYFDPDLLARLPQWLAVIALLGGVTVFVLSGLRSMVGGSVRDWLKPSEERLASRLEARYRRQVGRLPG